MDGLFFRYPMKSLVPSPRPPPSNHPRPQPILDLLPDFTHLPEMLLVASISNILQERSLILTHLSVTQLLRFFFIIHLFDSLRFFGGNHIGVLATCYLNLVLTGSDIVI